jgi:hypothetical protein
MKGISFTGEGLAKALLLHLTARELDEYLKSHKTKTRMISDGFWAKLRRRIWPRKIFLIRFKDSSSVIIMANDEVDACVQAVPFLNDGQVAHSCENPKYDSACKECRAAFDELAKRLNEADVTWLGWGQPDYNWVIHI